MNKLLYSGMGPMRGLPVAAMMVLGPLGFAAAESTTVGVEVTFVDSVAISDPSALQAGSPVQSLTGGESVTIAAAESAPPPADAAEAQTAASLTITATPGRPMTIYVDSVVPGPAYSMTDFRCSYGAATDVPCDGAGFSETAAASGTLRIGATLLGGATTEDTGDGRFEVTVSYQ